MRVRAVTVGIPVRDLERAITWYRSALNLGEPDLLLSGLAEFNLDVFWLQLALAPERAGKRGVSLNISVEDASLQRRRFAEQGLPVSDLQRFDDAVEYFELTDPDGNEVGFVTELI